MGKHAGPLDIPREFASWWFATEDWPEPLRGRHHVTCAPAIIRAHYQRWNASTERTHTRKEELSG